EKITTPTQKEKVVAYALKASRLSDRERTGALGENDEKTGVDTGAKAINPLTGSLIPVWIGDYVLGHYGTGAIMSVPAHDQRDWLFATRQNLPIIPVVTPPKNISHDFSHSAFEGDGASLSPGGKYLPTPLAKESVISWLVEEHLGKKTTTYRLRDWLFSRQRYWGEPIPLISDGLGHFEPLDEKELPLTLPDLDEIRPPGDGRSPLALAEDWVETSRGKRETHTMPQWAGSCWYYLRYLDPKNEEMLVSKEKEATWMPVDLYVGGAEHAVLHLLYARFWHKVLYDIGVVSTKEPFKKLINVGMIQGCDGQKMSKSKGNVVNPDDVIERFGADAFRMYEMFMGPFTGSAPWNTDGIPGIRRFLGRAWRLLLGRKELVGDSLSQTIRHQTILKVSEDIDRFRFNTAISALMVYLNSLEEQGCSLADRKTFLRLLTPFAPHMAEEIHQRLEWEGLAALAPWPQANEESAQESRVTVPVMVNGKLRATLDLPVDCPETTVREHALSEENVQRHLGSKKPRRIIIVTNRVINIVI
ncbi:leucine--tRNA ligase, partial [bacterium]|nr:leucine--tRNA ligase [bacterium]